MSNRHCYSCIFNKTVFEAFVAIHTYHMLPEYTWICLHQIFPFIWTDKINSSERFILKGHFSYGLNMKSSAAVIKYRRKNTSKTLLIQASVVKYLCRSYIKLFLNFFSIRYDNFSYMLSTFYWRVLELLFCKFSLCKGFIVKTLVVSVCYCRWRGLGYDSLVGPKELFNIICMPKFDKRW